MKPGNEKTIYSRYYSQKVSEFLLSDKTDLELSKPGSMPWHQPYLKEKDIFEKDCTFDKIQFVSKNKVSDTILWKTTPEKLRQGVRWGIVRAESITGKVISTLGKYRLQAHKRISKGTISRLQSLKLNLLDVYQTCIEALQPLESLVNSDSSVSHYQTKFKEYIAHLRVMQNELDNSPLPTLANKQHYRTLIQKVKSSIDNDIKRAEFFLADIEDQQSTKASNRAKGEASIVEFVKRQMHFQLSSLDGLNQDIAFGKKALTRGKLSVAVANAHKCIDDHMPDMRNAVTAKHHGNYASHENQDKDIIYDFNLRYCPPSDERNALLAVSFIEGWDTLNDLQKKPTVSNQHGKADLKKITSTFWNTHRHFGRYLWEYTKNWFKGIFFETPPWQDGVNDDFKLHAHTLMGRARLDYPLWKRTWHYFQYINYLTTEFIFGMYRFTKDFIFNFPQNIKEDWHSTNAVLSPDIVMKRAQAEVDYIEEKESSLLTKVLIESEQEKIPDIPRQDLYALARPEFQLSNGELQDFINVCIKNFGGFSGQITHEIFNKDPLGGMLFLAAFLAGSGILALPGGGHKLLLAKTTKLFGTGSITETVFAGLTKAQMTHFLYDGMVKGPSSYAADYIASILNDPLPNAIGMASSYALGYVMSSIPEPKKNKFLPTEFIGGELFKYPIGLQFGPSGVTFVLSDKTTQYHAVDIAYNGEEFQNIKTRHLSSQDLITLGKLRLQFQLVQLLNINASKLLQLSLETRFELCRVIDNAHFTPNQAKSLKKMLYPEESKSSGYHFFAVPLMYIPAIARAFVSIFIYPLAFLYERPNYKAPLKRAFGDLFAKINTDIYRLEAACSSLLSITFDIVTSPIIATLFVCNFIIARLCSLVNIHPGHTIYKAFAAFHDFYRDMCGFLTPVRWIKSVHVADAVHTNMVVVETYARVLNEFGGRREEDSFEPLPEVMNHGHPLNLLKGSQQKNMNLNDVSNPMKYEI